MLFAALLSVPSAAGENRGDGMIPFLAITGRPAEAEVRAKVAPAEPCTSLRPCYDPLYRQTKPFDLAAGGRLAQVRLAGRDLGVRAWAPFEWNVPADLAGKKALLEISVSTSVQPVFGDPAACSPPTGWNRPHPGVYPFFECGNAPHPHG